MHNCDELPHRLVWYGANKNLKVIDYVGVTRIELDNNRTVRCIRYNILNCGDMLWHKV